MSNKRKPNLTYCAASIIAAIATLLSAATISIENSGFESKWDGWLETYPSAISSDSYSGKRAAKITGSDGRAEQTISVEPNTNYNLTAYIEGSGQIGAIVDGLEYSQAGGSDEFEQVSLEFNSGSATSITIFAAYGGNEGRFDNFTLTTSNTANGNTDDVDNGNLTPLVCSSTSNLTIINASDKGKNDGHGSELYIDFDLSNDSRWSSLGSGKEITYELSELSKVKMLQVNWYKGGNRSAFFDVDTSINSTDWTSVLVSGQSSGSDDGFESEILAETDARFVRITGYGNSSDGWNSIVEAKILGCASADDDNDNSTDSFDWEDWKITLPVNSDTWYDDGNKSSAAELQPLGCAADMFSEDLSIEYFWSDDEGLHFKVPMNLDGTTPNTSYVRSELRELYDWAACETTSRANWAYGGTHTLTASVRIDDFDADNTKVVLRQIHGHDISYATIKLHWEGDNKPIRVIYNETPNKSTPNNVYLGYVNSSDFWEYTIKMTDEGNELSAGGVTETIKFGDELNEDWRDETFYFKAGLYPQQKPDSSSTEVYEATFSNIEVTHK